MQEIPNTLDSGIVPIAHHLGRLSTGKSYFLTGGQGSGKTTFVLQFIHQGLQERQTCILVSGEPPENLTAHAEKMGMDLTPFLKNQTLLVYEIARKDAYPPAELLSELDNILTQSPADRFALEGLTQSIDTAMLLKKLKENKTTSFITLPSPAAEPVLPLKTALENAAEGVLQLQPTSEERIKTFSVKKWGGARQTDGPFEFRIEPGQGIVEAVKMSGIKFPRLD